MIARLFVALLLLYNTIWSCFRINFPWCEYGNFIFLHYFKHVLTEGREGVYFSLHLQKNLQHCLDPKDIWIGILGLPLARCYLKISESWSPICETGIIILTPTLWASRRTKWGVTQSLAFSPQQMLLPSYSNPWPLSHKSC